MGITVSTLYYPDKVKAKLVNLNSVIINENREKDYTLFNIDLKNPEYKNSFKKVLARKIAEIVIDDLENKLINNIINHNYGQYSLEERVKIEDLALKHLRKRDKIDAKINIITQLMKYLDHYKDINIEGFVRFRMKDYVERLHYTVERAVDDYIVEKEYDEFIELLRYFVNLQEPRINKVNVVQEDNGSFKILDLENNEITSEYLEEYILELMDGDVEYEDLLISALINISPGKITLHFRDEEVEKTLKSIFSDRVSLCDGCELCQGKDP